MNIELFPSIQEGKDFLNYKANQRIRKLEALIEQNQKEIDNNLEKCNNIFAKYSEPNYIDSLLKIELEKKNNETPEETESTVIEENENLTKKLNSFLSELLQKYSSENVDLTKKMEYLTDKEDIEFAYKKIKNRKDEINNKKGLVNEIETCYASARTFNAEEFKKQSITFKMINEYLNETKDYEEQKNNVEEIINTEDKKNESDLYVVRIEEAPESLKVEEEQENKVTFNNNIEIESDTSFFGIDDNLTEAILNDEKISFEDVQEEQPENIENQILEVELETNENNVIPESIELDSIKLVEPIEEDLNNEEVVIDNNETENKLASDEEIEIDNAIDIDKIESNSLPEDKYNNIPNEEDSKIESKEEEIITQEEITQVESNNEEISKEDSKVEDTLTYTLDENDNLHNLAVALFQDDTLTELAIKRIIEENKEKISERLKEKNISENEDYSKQNGLFAGITLNLSKVFDRVIEDKNNL